MATLISLIPINHHFATALTAVALFPMAGCSVEHLPARSNLCQVVDPRGWTMSKDWPTSGRLEDHGLTFIFGIDDSGSHQPVRGPMPKVFWISITGMTSGAASPEFRRPVIYDPSEAILEIDGKKVPAIRKLWASEQVKGFYQPVPEVPIPTDLNAHHKGTVGSFFVGFPIEPPTAKQTYTFHPGTALLDGKRFPLPSFGSCYFPSKRWLSPIH